MDTKFGQIAGDSFRTLHGELGILTRCHHPSCHWRGASSVTGLGKRRNLSIPRTLTQENSQQKEKPKQALEFGVGVLFVDYSRVLNLEQSIAKVFFCENWPFSVVLQMGLKGCGRRLDLDVLLIQCQILEVCLVNCSYFKT